MADRLTDIILGLQRMAEAAHMRVEDLEYTQREERHDLIQYVDQMLVLVEKLHKSLLEDRKRLQLAERVEQQPMPRIVKQGPKEAAS